MRTNLLAYLLPLALLGGCGGDLGDAATVSAALDSSDDTATESALLVASVDATESAATADEAAAMAAASAKTWYQPSTCLTATAATNVATYTLTDCTGPWGLVHVTGSVIVTYTKQADGLHADANATGLLVDGATLNLDSQAVYSVTGTTKTLVVATDGGGTGRRGTRITRHGSYTLTWDTASMCGTLDGDWSTGVNGATWSTTMSGYRQCQGACPATGTLAHTGGLSHVTVTVTFDGSADARWTSSRGHSGTVALSCNG
jgi:hypothetical protein